MPRISRARLDWLLLALLAEKVLQHVFVTWAFATDLDAIRASVEIDYRWLMWSGGLLVLLFAGAALLHWRHRREGLFLAIALALVDVIGEFVAQGTFGITINVSFLVGIAILVIAGWGLRTGQRFRAPAVDRA